MKFFIDNNLPVRFAEALNALSEGKADEVVHLRKKFSPSTPDHVWISKLAQEQHWVIISQDRFKKNPFEKEAFKKSGLTAFFLKKSWAHQNYWDKAHMIVRWWPRIIEQAEGVAPGATFEVPYRFSGKGKFEQFNF